MVTYAIIPAWEGAAGIAVSARGVAYIALSSSAATAERAIRARFPDAQHDARALGDICAQLSDYFAGKCATFDAPLDLDGLSAFQRAVLKACARIPYGRTMTYAQLAQKLGAPQAARAVGGALARNPIPIVIPCHRVVSSSGALGGFSAEQGVALKRRLLEHEAQRAVPEKAGSARPRLAQRA